MHIGQGFWRRMIMSNGVGLLAVLLLAPMISAVAVDVEKGEGPTGQSAEVLGGTLAGWPWLGALLYADESDPFYAQFCGGSLIAPQWVLTAAHCVEGSQADDLDVMFGSTYLYPGLGLRYRVDEIVMHDAYVPDDAVSGVIFDNDIALLKLSEAVDFIDPVKLAAPSFNVDEMSSGTNVTLRGWGATSYDEEEDEGDDYPIALRTVDLAFRNTAECELSLGAESLTSNMLCAGFVQGGRDTCYGDSGGNT